MPHRALALVPSFITGFLVTTAIGQFTWAVAQAIQAAPNHLPDIVSPINTSVLALLWWRVARVEKDTSYLRDRIDRSRARQKEW